MIPIKDNVKRFFCIFSKFDEEFNLVFHNSKLLSWTWILRCNHGLNVNIGRMIFNQGSQPEKKISLFISITDRVYLNRP